MAVPFLPSMFPPIPPPPWDQNQNTLPPPFPNSWRPPPFPSSWRPPPRPPGVFTPAPFLPRPSLGNVPPPLMSPPHHNTSQMYNMFPWKPQKSCDSVRPMGFPPGRGSKRGRRMNRSNTQSKPPGAFECKPCAKEYRTEETYQTHLQSHVKCSSCDFEGSGKALKEHELFHILPDQLKFSSEQDIKKWREERRKNFPTAENIARKKRLADDKKERGESAVTPLHRYIKHLTGEDSQSGRGMKRRGKGRAHVSGKPFNQCQGPSKRKCPSYSNIEVQNENNDCGGNNTAVSHNLEDSTQTRTLDLENSTQTSSLDLEDSTQKSSLDLEDSTQTSSCDQEGILGAILADCTVSGSAGLVSLDVDGAAVDPPLDNKPPDEANPVSSVVSSEDKISRKKVRVDSAECSTTSSKWKSRKQIKRNKKMNVSFS